MQAGVRHLSPRVILAELRAESALPELWKPQKFGNHQINHAEGLEEAFRDEQDGSGLVSYRMCTTRAHGCVSERGTGAYL